MSRPFGPPLAAALIGCALAFGALAESSQHPCTGEALPLTTEGAVVRAAECLSGGRVIKVDRAGSGGDWVYQLRILFDNGRVRTLDFEPDSGQPTDPSELE